MADKNAVFLTRHIGKTTYKVRVYLSETAEETMEDKILRLIRNDGLANQPECGIMELPQMSRPSERTALRLKHRSDGCGTASALPKCSIIHKVLSALLA